MVMVNKTIANNKHYMEITSDKTLQAYVKVLPKNSFMTEVPII